MNKTTTDNRSRPVYSSRRDEMLSPSIHSQQARLAAIYEVSARLGTTLDLTKLLNLVMDSIIELTGAERGFIMLFDAKAQGLQAVAARNFDRETIDGETTNISRTVVNRALTTGEAILTSNAQEDQRFANFQSVIGYHLRSIMVAPLRVRGRIIGAAYVDNRFVSSVFSRDDLDLLVTFANQAAIAIDNAQLFTQTDQALARRVEELSFFQKIDHELNRSLDLDHILNLALDWAIQLTNAENGAIGLIEEADDGVSEIRILTRKGNQTDVEYSIQTQHPLLAQALVDGVAARSRHESALGGAPVTQLVVPIKTDEEITGLILLDSPNESAFDTDDIAFVERLSDRASVAIHNAQLYQAVHAAKQQQSDFIAVVAHELRTPMTTIMGYTDLMMTGATGDLNDEQNELLAIVMNNVHRMQLLVQDLADLNRLEMGQIKFHTSTFAVQEVAEEVRRSLRDRIQAKRQRLTLMIDDNLPQLYADRDRTVQILTNLVINAHKYTKEEGRIGIRARREEDMVAIDVIDNGIGIGDADQAHLFKRFFRVANPIVRKQKGWGLGLAIVKMLAEAQNGSVRFHSEEGKGSVFTVILPSAAAAP